MSNNMKFLLLNITLLAGMYYSCGCSRCAGCCKNCCGNGDNKKDLYFKIEGEAIDSNGLGCFGSGWFTEYQNKKNGNNEDTILLYKLTERQEVPKEAVGTLVYSKKLKYTNGGDFPKDLKDSDNKWAIFKVTTINEDNEATPGESHIFYCSDVSTLNDRGLFEFVKCYSIEILAANTQRVETFYSMFYMTTSYLEKDIEQPDASGFIGLEKLDLSSAQNLAMMFYEALYKQKTVYSLKDWILKNGANISKMFYVDISKFFGSNGPDFSVLGGLIKRNNVHLKYSDGSKYDIFFQGEDNSQNKDKLPKWYENNIKEEPGS